MTMYKILFIHPITKEQMITTVAESGGVASDCQVLWDERTQGPIPQKLEAPFIAKKDSDEAAKSAKRAAKEALTQKLNNDSITDAELKQLLKAVLAG